LPGGTNFDETFYEFLPKAAIAYDVTPNVRVGALVSRGANPGGVLEVLGLGVFEYKEESLWNFEVFSRASFWEDRVQLSTNAFHTRVKDYQIFTNALAPGFEFLGPQGKIENADKVVTYGLDLTADAQVTDDLIVNASLGLLKTEIKEFTATTDPIVGNSLPRAPGITFSIGAQYDVIEDLTIGGDLRYVSSYYGSATNTPSVEAGSYVVVDLNAAYDVNDYFQIFGSVNNLLNTDYTVQQFGTGAARRVGFGDPFEFTVGGELRF
ncbi:MAG: TonB-dependent receptor, partial [Pseudomonadota bacterium]